MRLLRNGSERRLKRGTRPPDDSQPVGLSEEGPTGRRSDLAKMARDIFIKLGGHVADGVFSLVFVVVVTRGLGTVGAGAFFQTVALFMILMVLVRWGADTGLLRMIPRYRALGRTQDVRRTLAVGIGPVLLSGTVLAIGVIAFAPQLADVLTHRGSGDHLVGYIRTLAPFLPVIAALGVSMSASRGFGTMVPMVVLDNFGKSGLRPLLMLVVVSAGLGTVAVSLAWAIPAVLALVAVLIWIRALLARAERVDGYDPGPPRRMGEIASDFWKFAGPRGFASLFTTLTIWLDTLLVGALGSPRAVGVYVATTRLLKIGTFAIGTINLVISPQLSAMFAREDNDRANTVYQTSTWWLMIPSWPIFITFSVFAPFLLRIFGPDFAAGQHAMMILSLAMLVAMATGPVTVALLMGGHSGWNMANALVSLALNVVLNLILIPRLGITGAAIAWMVSIVVNNLASFFEVRILMGLRSLGQGFWVVAFGSLFCYGALGLAVRLTLGMSLPIFLLWGVAATALYFVLLWRNRALLNLPILRDALRSRSRGGGRRGARMGETEPVPETLE